MTTLLICYLVMAALAAMLERWSITSSCPFCGGPCKVGGWWLSVLIGIAWPCFAIAILVYLSEQKRHKR